MFILSIIGGTYSLKSFPKERFLRNFIRQFYFTFRSTHLLKGSHRRKKFIFSFWCLVSWAMKLGLTASKLTHYLLDYGDYIVVYNENRKSKYQFCFSQLEYFCVCMYVCMYNLLFNDYLSFSWKWPTSSLVQVVVDCL